MQVPLKISKSSKTISKSLEKPWKKTKKTNPSNETLSSTINSPKNGNADNTSTSSSETRQDGDKTSAPTSSQVNPSTCPTPEPSKVSSASHVPVNKATSSPAVEDASRSANAILGDQEMISIQNLERILRMLREPVPEPKRQRPPVAPRRQKVDPIPEIPVLRRQNAEELEPVPPIKTILKPPPPIQFDPRLHVPSRPNPNKYAYAFQ